MRRRYEKYDYIILRFGPAAYKLVKLLDTQHKSILTVESGFVWVGTCPKVLAVNQKYIFRWSSSNSFYQINELKKGIIYSRRKELNWAQLMKDKRHDLQAGQMKQEEKY